MEWKMKPETYYDIGHDLSHKVDCWIANGDDYQIIPSAYTTPENRDAFHIQESNAILAGRIDHSSKRISIRHGALKVLDEKYVEYIKDLLRMDYQGYTLYEF